MKQIVYFMLLVLMACSNPSTPNPNPNPNEPSVTISSPSGTVYTNGNINIQVVVSGAAPDTIELLKNKQVLVGNLTAPYSYTWDTKSEAEGVYELVARASAGGKTVDSEIRSVTIDRSKPSLVSHTPEANAKNFWTKDPIVLTFSEAIHPASVNGSSITLRDKDYNSIPLQLELSQDGKTLTLQPTTLPTVPNKLQLQVESEPFDNEGLTDLAGNYISYAYWAWDLPLWQQPGGKVLDVETAKVVSQPSLAVDKEGNITVAWLEANDIESFNALYVKHWNGNSWVQLGEDLRFDKTLLATAPSLALDSTGKPILAWSEHTSLASKIYVKRWDSTAWVQVGDPIGEQASSPSLALDSKDNPVLAWAESNSTFDAASILVTRWDGNDWQSVGAALNAGFGKVPSLRLDAGDKPVVAWEEWDALNNIYVKRFDGKDWLPVGDFLDTAPEPWAKTPSLALDASGNPVVAWSEWDADMNPTKSLLYLKRWDGSQWKFVGTGNPLNFININRAFEPSLQLDGEGNPFLTWQEAFTNGSFTALKYFRENTWKVLVSDGQTAHMYAPSLALDASDDPVVARAAGSSAANTDLYVKRKNPGNINN